MRHLSLIPILLALFSFAPLAAQDAPPDTGWPVEQRCVGDPTPPPADWTYDGTIFFQDQQGIHAVNAQSEQPYYVLFDNDFISGAGLSPDGKWYAVPDGHTSETTMMGTPYYYIEAILIYRTDGTRDPIRLPWKADYSGIRGIIPPIEWLDNNRFVYVLKVENADEQAYLVNPFTGENIQLGSEIIKIPQSPDDSRAILRAFDFKKQESGIGLYDPSDVQHEIAILPRLVYPDRPDLIFWLPDSSAFISIFYDESDSGLSYIALIDREGQNYDPLLTTASPESISYKGLSADGHYFSYIQDTHIYIAAINERKLLDFCISVNRPLGLPGAQPDYVSWSPVGNQLAFASNSSIVVLDVDTGGYYRIAIHPGEVVAWGAAD